eukprot:2586139-Prymnesium_polylepis.1
MGEFSRSLGLSSPRLSLRTRASIYKFRALHGVGPPPGTPAVICPLAIGMLADLHIQDVFPTTKCYMKVDLETFAIRWADNEFISLHAVED